MKEFEWIDDMTEQVTLNSLIFTPDVATLTLVTANFDVSLTGRIVPSYSAVTHAAINESEYFDLWRGVTFVFLAATILRFLLVVYSLFALERPRTVKEFSVRRELRIDVLMTFLWMAFAVFILIRKHLDKSLLSHVLDLLNCFLGATEASVAEILFTVDVYFKTMDTMLEQYAIENAINIFSYVMVIGGILRLVGYMSVHPRIDVISRTLINAADDVFHFLVVFSFMFIGFMARTNSLFFLLPLFYFF